MIDPQDIDPDTGRPYPNYSSPSLDTSFHDGEMNVDDCPHKYQYAGSAGHCIALYVCHICGDEYEKDVS